jgi:hypothetical protein
MRENWTENKSTETATVVPGSRNDEKFKVGSNITLSLEDPKALSEKLNNFPSLQVTADSPENLKRMLTLEVGTKKASLLIENIADQDTKEEGSIAEKQQEIVNYVAFAEEQSREQLNIINDAKDKVEGVCESISEKLGALSIAHPDIITEGFSQEFNMRHIHIKNLLEKLAVVISFKGQASVKFAQSLDLDTTSLDMLRMLNSTQEEIRAGLESKYRKLNEIVGNLDDLAENVSSVDSGDREDVLRIKEDIGKSALGMNKGSVEYDPKQEMLEYKDRIDGEMKNLDEGLEQLRRFDKRDADLENFKKFNGILAGAEMYRDLYSRFNATGDVREFKDKISGFRYLFIQKFYDLPGRM